MTAPIGAALETSVILAMAVAAAALMRRQSAAARHWLLAMAFVCVGALPFLGPVVPRWTARLDSLPGWTEPQDVPTSAGVSAEARAGSPVGASARQSAVERSRRGPAAAALRGLGFSIWLAGTAAGLGVLAVRLIGLMLLAPRSRPVVHQPTLRVAEQVARASRLRRPVCLIQTDRPALLVTWGLLRPKIVLPSDVFEWPEDRLRAVLAHEFAHVRRGDWAFQVLGECLRCAYWFNPLVWLACARLRHESEYACDDAVLNSGVEGPVYAQHMLEVARAFSRHRRAWLPAAGIAPPSSLERRVRAMLNAQTNRTPLAGVPRTLMLGGLVAVAIVLAGFGAAGQNPFSTFSGSVVDPMNGVLPDTRLVLVNTATQAKYEVRTDDAGRFQVAGLPAGAYTFEASRPGFATMKGTVAVSGQDVQRDLRLEIGSIAEMIVVSGGSGAASSASQTVVRSPSEKREATGCVPSAVGGMIRPPRKVVDVKPVYPAQLRAAGIDGVVLLDARIGTDGTVHDLRVVNDAHPDLAAAAIDAVRQWDFDWTLLNCVPIELTMHVTVDFRH